MVKYNHELKQEGQEHLDTLRREREIEQYWLNWIREFNPEATIEDAREFIRDQRREEYPLGNL